MAKTGYKKPPTHRQFKKGKSGNPSGRPKRDELRKPFKHMIQDCLFEEVEVVMSGRRRKVPIFQAILINLRTQALRSDPRAIKLVLALAEEHVPHERTLVDLMAGRRPFEWTKEDEKEFSKAKLLEGVPVIGGPKK